ncbi:RagB/SusD family nutrient uptake outer membrane protein [Marinoscillum furvescens]|uniref:Putative outer membrane starch-binding protein n=1 Tax=Marinoscillum furvescens DSM 4134 TaxID=1122208 RepID=A0A3D9L3F0_MARFU|nr:RagB/SusD family nutrient uptake outer membrane protein [Marinoscillum furvescens]RED99816.1 putative outer membrane starch-binding protein [Marinoscillum furvescens DSM 4134]
MKRIFKNIALIAGSMLAVACSDDFVNVEPKGTALEENYYKNAEQAYNGVIAAYDPLGWTNGFVIKTASLNAASDDFFTGGGGPNDMNAIQVWDKYTLDPVNGPQQEFWNKNYSGIFRANILLSRLPEIDMDESLKSRFTAEMKFLRAYYYFDMVRLFERFPLLTAPIPTAEIFEVEAAERSSVFAQIEQDLSEAIADLPATITLETDAGRATKGAAIALLGKVYLQQEKFSEAAAQFAQVNGTPGSTSQYGYRLLDDFADLFKVANEFNEESIFEISHNSTSQGNWGCVACTEGNPLAIMVAPRGYVINDPAVAPNYVSGWSFNTVTPSLVNAFVQDEVYDPRYSTTIVNIDSLEQIGAVSYEHAYENTGYFLAKFAGKESDKTADSTVPFEINFPTNEYEIRLADTYLMEAEALVRGGGDQARAQALLDAVRERVGLPSVPATFDNIMAERRLELAGEGHRWFDLVRTGQAASVLADRGYVEGKHDALPIPQSELEFDGTKLEQDPAYQ